MKNINYLGKCLLFVLAVILQINGVNAQNLVPNPSFEEYSDCPDNFYQNVYLSWWNININTADYFNRCSNSEFVSIPNNSMGYQDTPDIDTSCGGYCGLISYVDLIENTREYIGTNLLESLTAGQRYYVSFKISLADNSKYAVNNVGILFTNRNFNEISISEPFLSIDPESLLGNFAQIYSEEVISDKENWITIRDTFIADSAYSNILIGNFFDDLNTIVHNAEGLDIFSYYYIDDVCVSIDSTYCWDYVHTCGINTVNDIIKNGAFIYPNPTESYFTVEIQKINNSDNSYLELYNVLGELVFDKHLTSVSTSLNTEYLKSGMYCLYIYRQ